MGVSSLLLFGAIIFIIIGAAVGLGNVFGSDNSQFTDILNATNADTSREILEQRFAQGKISRDEYESMKSCLE